MDVPIEVNYIAVLVAAIASMAVGYLWYGPIFGKMWMSLSGISKEQIDEAKAKGGMGKNYAIAYVFASLMAYVLAHFVNVWQVVDVVSAFQLTFWVWLGFIVTVMANSVLWERKPVKLYFLNIAHYLVAIFVMALILTLWP